MHRGKNFNLSFLSLIVVNLLWDSEILGRLLWSMNLEN